MSYPRILIADDDDPAVHTLQRQLESLGFTVIGNARTNAEMLDHAVRTRPDLIIANVRLLDIEACERMRRIKAPLLALASSTDGETEDRAIRSGAFGCLRLPIDDERIAPAIAIAIARFRDIHALRQRVDALADEIKDRDIIDRAKYILMQRTGLSERDAYTRLRHYARNSGKKLKDIAWKIIAEASV